MICRILPARLRSPPSGYSKGTRSGLNLEPWWICNTNRKTVPLTLKNVIHLPIVLVNLFRARKLLDQYNGYVGGRKLRNSKLEEFAQYDEYRLIIEAPRKYALPALTSLALPAALEQAKPSLALWHRRLGHIGLKNVRKTQKITKGIQFKEQGEP